MPCGIIAYEYGWDYKEVMPMWTLCPVCDQKATNPYASEETEMNLHSDHKYASKSEHFSIVYCHKKCIEEIKPIGIIPISIK